jgi:uncharacterized protein YjbJ (UPF0337 family)
VRQSGYRSAAARDGSGAIIGKKEKIMSWDHVEANWPEVQGRLKEQWSHITDEDIEVIEAPRPELEGLLKK